MFFSKILYDCIKKPLLSIDEALYLAKEVGITTKAELQRLIVLSPPFSPDKSPFLINNIYRKVKVEDDEEDSVEVEHTTQDDKIITANQENITKIDKIIASTINPENLNVFWHNNNWWKVYSEAYGTCMRSTSHVIIQRGSGIVKVNKEEDVYKRWPLFYNRMDVLEPFYLAGCAGVYDLYIQTHGGGTTGQSRATRLAVARALVDANPVLHYQLKDALYEDTRQRMPKMPGRTGARAQRKWVKR